MFLLIIHLSCNGGGGKEEFHHPSKLDNTLQYCITCFYWQKHEIYVKYSIILKLLMLGI